MTPNEKLCPLNMIEQLTLYRDEGLPPSGFTRACLENNLLEAHLRADDVNLPTLPHIVAWIYWNMPTNIWKSREAVNRHLESFIVDEPPERDEPIVYNRGELPSRDNRDEHDRTL